MSEPTSYSRRNVFILAVCQALSMTGTGLVLTVSALAGSIIAPDKALATLPFALMFVGAMAFTIPASLFMGRFGRRMGFTLGQLFGISSAALSAYALYEAHFWWFCFGGFMLGIHSAFFQYYRFAAADAATPSFRPKAISYVLAGGVFAAIAGPELAKMSKDLYSPFLFVGSYVVIVCLSMLSVTLLQFIRIPRPSLHERRQSGRPLREISRQPAFIVAILAAMIGYSAMNMVMTATPLAMVACGFEFDDAAFVIQWHVLGMFAPSFFTGNLIHRFGALRIIITGTVLMAACMVINLMGIALTNFWLALVLIGVGWNFMFIGGTSLLTETYEPSERAKVQALNDFLVFGTVAAGSFSSGALQNMFGWQAVNAAISLPVLLAFAASLWLTIHRRKLGII